MLLTPHEVASLLRVTPRTIRNWTNDGMLEPIRLGGRLVRYRRESIDALMAPSNEQRPGPNPVAAEGHAHAPRCEA